MSERIKLDTIGLGEILILISNLQNDIQTTRSELSTVIGNLDWEVKSKEQIEGQLNNVSKELCAQEERLSQMDAAVKTAITKSDGFNADFVNKASGILTAVIATISAFFSGSKNGLVNNLTGIKNWLSSSYNGNYDAILNNQRSVNYVWTSKGDSLLKEIEERDRSFLNNADGTANLKKLGGWEARNASDKKVNCKWFTQHKIQWLTGRAIDMNHMEALSKTEGFDYNGMHFEVINRKAGNETLGDILGKIHQPAENIVLTWDKPHSMMIDKIQDGKVYCSDNRTEQWNIYLRTKTLPAKEYDLEKFIKTYQSLAGNPSYAFQIVRY